MLVLEIKTKKTLYILERTPELWCLGTRNLVPQPWDDRNKNQILAKEFNVPGLQREWPMFTLLQALYGRHLNWLLLLFVLTFFWGLFPLLRACLCWQCSDKIRKYQGHIETFKKKRKSNSLCWFLRFKQKNGWYSWRGTRVLVPGHQNFGAPILLNLDILLVNPFPCW